MLDLHDAICDSTVRTNGRLTLEMFLLNSIKEIKKLHLTSLLQESVQDMLFLSFFFTKSVNAVSFAFIQQFI